MADFPSRTRWNFNVETATEIIETLAQLGVTVKAVGPDRLRIEPASKVPADLLPRIREAKPELLALIRTRPATCATSCYEIEPGRWVHRPWNGCKTGAPSGAVRAVPQSICRHCNGTGVCPCPACNLRRTSDAVPCCMCRPMERQVWLAATRQEEGWDCGASGEVARVH